MLETRTEKVYHYIRRYLKEHGYPPGLDEMAESCDLSAQQVQACLGCLESVGRLTYRPDRPRGMRLTPEAPAQLREIQTARSSGR